MTGDRPTPSRPEAAPPQPVSCQYDGRFCVIHRRAAECDAPLAERLAAVETLLSRWAATGMHDEVRRSAHAQVTAALRGTS